MEASLPMLEDGIILAVEFVDSQIIEDCSSEAKHITCSMTFMATKPISISNYIVITDTISGKRYLQVTRIGLLRTYIFLLGKNFHFQ